MGMTKEQALQLIEKTADQLKKGGFDFLLFASKPTGARMAEFTEQSIVTIMEAGKPADLTSALTTYAIDEPRFTGLLMCVCQQIDDIMDDARKHDKEETPSIVDLQNSQSEESTAPMTGIGKRMKVITLCGSTRFKEQFLEQQKRLTLEGNIVISVGLFGHSGDEEVWKPGTKEMLDKMHFQKIDMADEIFVINVGGYIGESTRREIAHAEQTGKPVRYLESI